MSFFNTTLHTHAKIQFYRYRSEHGLNDVSDKKGKIEVQLHMAFCL